MPLKHPCEVLLRHLGLRPFGLEGNSLNSRVSPSSATSTARWRRSALRALRTLRRCGRFPWFGLIRFGKGGWDWWLKMLHLKRWSFFFDCLFWFGSIWFVFVWFGRVCFVWCVLFWFGLVWFGLVCFGLFVWEVPCFCSFDSTKHRTMLVPFGFLICPGFA